MPQRWEDLKRKKFSPEKLSAIQQRVEQEVLELNLRALRETMGKTQEELSALAQISQSELSRAERRQDHLLSTLRRYVEAMGGELEVLAVFGDKQIRLIGV